MAKPPEPPLQALIAALQQRQPTSIIKALIDLGANPPAKPARPARGKPPPAQMRPDAPPALPPELGALPGGLSPGEVPASRAAIWDWALVALLGYLAYRLLAG